MKCEHCHQEIVFTDGEWMSTGKIYVCSGNSTHDGFRHEPEPTEAAPSQGLSNLPTEQMTAHSGEINAMPREANVGISFYRAEAEREAVVGGQPPKDDGLCLAGCGASRDDPSHSIMRCSPKRYPQSETPRPEPTSTSSSEFAETGRLFNPPRPEMGKDALRDFVEQAQSICESATGPSVSDISKLRRLGKIAFPQGFKTLVAASGTESAPSELSVDQKGLFANNCWGWNYLMKLRNAIFATIPEELKSANYGDDELLAWPAKLALKPQPSSLTPAWPLIFCLKEIARRGDCECTHADENCCAGVGVYCDKCWAAAALAGMDKMTAQEKLALADELSREAAAMLAAQSQKGGGE